MSTQVFLGGSCNPTTWRKDVAIPSLTKAGVSFYNPQVENWSPELVAVEAAAKKEAEVLLFVIDGQTRAIASMLEAAEYISTGRRVVLVVQNIADGTEIAGSKVTGGELKDLNRARAYLLDIAKRYETTVVASSVEEAVAEATATVLITA